MTRRVVILQRRLPEYRVPFFARLQTFLVSRGIELKLVHGPPAPEEVSRADGGSLPWATAVPTRYVSLPGLRLVLPAVPRSICDSAELVIAPHESSYIPTYPLLVRRRRGGPRFAFWGHGPETALDGRPSLRQRFKRFTAGLPDWWFAYTQLSVSRVIAAGFPADRITCVNNSVSTSTALLWVDTASGLNRDEIRRRMGITGENVAVFLGSLSESKRLDLLLGASDILRHRLQDFHLVVVGDGPERRLLDAATASRPWLHLVGARHGREKNFYCSLGRVMLSPGMVGLNIVDAFALGIPFVTTDYPDHSPEIAYLAPGENGLQTGQRTEDFAAAAESILRDGALHHRLQAGCARDAERYTVDNMASAFAEGIFAALEASRRERRAPRTGRAAAAATGGDGGPARRLRVLVFHTALAPYRVDFLNALSELCALRVLFLHSNVLEQKFDQDRLRSLVTADIGYLTRGITVLERTIRLGIAREIARFRPDVVVTSEFSPTTLGVCARRAISPPSYAHVVWTDDNPLSVSRDAWLRRAARALALRRIDGVVTLSEEAAQMYRGRFRATVPVTVAPLIQKEDAFRTGLSRAAAAARRTADSLGLAGKRVILSVGRLDREKRVDRLLSALPRVRSAVSDAALVVVGDGPERPRLVELCRSLSLQETTIFAGHLEGESLLAWYGIGAVLALTSEFEPFGAVVNEALLAGMPVVCSDQAGARSLIREGVNGTVLDCSQPEALSGALIEWLARSQPVPMSPAEVIRPSLMALPFSHSVDGFMAALDEGFRRARRDPASARHRG